MPHSNFNQIERSIRVRCQVTPPSDEQIGPSFQRNIGKSLNTNAHAGYSISPFPLSLLRDTKSFKKFCEQQLHDVPTEVGESCDLHLTLEVTTGVQKVLFPPVIYGSTCGPFPSDALAEMQKAIAWAVDHSWTSLQSYYVDNVAVVEATGMTSHALHGVYRWFWAVKDGLERSFSSVDNLLTVEYSQLARYAMHRGDDETAAQYSKIVFDLSPDQKANEIFSEFERVTDRWNELAVIKENAVKKVATVAREGVAEHWKFATFTYYRRDLLSPLTEELREFFSSYEVEKEREKLLQRSATNPYRRGLELVEAVEHGFGPVALLMWGIITEWPLEALRLRVPAYMVEHIQKNSPLAPDTRAAKLAELSQKATGHLPSPQNIMPMLQDVHKYLDDSLPGIMTSALCQLEIDKGRKPLE